MSLRQDPWHSPSHVKVCQRVSELMNRSNAVKMEKKLVGPDDFYLFQTGMAAIYNANRALLRWRAGPCVVFGFPYDLTLEVLKQFSSTVRFFPYGRDENLVELEEYLDGQWRTGKAVQAIWCECPSNPLLHTPNLRVIRQLANRYNAAVVVDDTIGTFANIDLLNVADLIITSLTKSFSGYADVMGGW